MDFIGNLLVLAYSKKDKNKYVKSVGFGLILGVAINSAFEFGFKGFSGIITLVGEEVEIVFGLIISYYKKSFQKYRH